MTFLPRIALLAAGIGLASCTYGGEASNPIERSFTWFSYVGGDDIRANCEAGSRDHFRFVYNGVYERQIRAYDLEGTPQGATLAARARGASGELTRFSVADPLKPWSLERAEVTLDNGEAARIVDALSRDAARVPPAEGRQVASNEFYWLVSACNEGAFRMWLFEHDRVDLATLDFPPLLLAHDRTGIAFREAETVEGFTDNVFYIKVREDGQGIVR